MLATPVASTLKLNFPGAKLTYWTHPGLRPILLGLCPFIDEVVDYKREDNFFQLAKTYENLRSDLFVDLANSTKSHAMTWLTRSKVLRYEKESPHIRPIKHAVTNFLDTVRPVCDELPDPLFPTIFPETLTDSVLDPFFEHHEHRSVPFIGLVPGVGKLRPHRAWLHDGWLYLIEHILSWKSHLPVLIGGSDEHELCAELNASAGGRALNVAGRLSLAETAAVLKQCQVVVSSDTGPAHIAVAVGTKVIGLYGPTFPQRSGPFGCMDLVLDESSNCRCHDQKHCRFAQPHAPGDCMRRIMLEEIIRTLKMLLFNEHLHQ